MYLEGEIMPSYNKKLTLNDVIKSISDLAISIKSMQMKYQISKLKYQLLKLIWIQNLMKLIKD